MKFKDALKLGVIQPELFFQPGQLRFGTRLQVASRGRTNKVNTPVRRCRCEQSEKENENAFIHRTTGVASGKGQARGRTDPQAHSSRGQFSVEPVPNRRSRRS